MTLAIVIEWTPNGPSNDVSGRYKLLRLQRNKCERGDLNPKKGLK